MADLFASEDPQPDTIDHNGVTYWREDLVTVKKAKAAPGFNEFWKSVPVGFKNGAKPAAKTAWGKLTQQQRKDAQERVAAFYGLSDDERLGASKMHVSRYLNSHAFYEEVLVAKQSTSSQQPSNVLEWWASEINGDGKLWSKPGDEILKQLLSTGMVTQQRMRERV